MSNLRGGPWSGYFTLLLNKGCRKYQEVNPVAPAETMLDDARLDETFAALANATRRAILARLAEGEMSVNDLAEPFDLTLPAISRHIKVLEHAGLITQGRRAQFRPCTIAVDALAEVADWTDQYRHIWDDRFDRIDGYVRKLQNTPKERDTTE